MIGIQMQQFNRSVSRWRDSNDSRTLESKMLRPSLPAWIEEKNHRPRHRVNRSKVSSFVAIAFGAGTGQVIAPGFAFVPDSDDVIYLMRIGRIILM